MVELVEARSRAPAKHGTMNVEPEKELKNVPKLRFPEFEGIWTETRLGELCSTFKSGMNITSERIRDEGEYPVFGGNGLRGYTDSFTHEGFYVLIGRQGALCGNINRAKGKSFISEHAIAASSNETSDTEWLAQRLEFLKLNRLSESSAQPGLAVNKLIKLKFVVPTQSEQQKIAAFLSAVDKKIQQLTRKKELLALYKKGVMQKIFSQEIRFKPDPVAEPGRNAVTEPSRSYPDWEEKQLRELVHFVNGKAHEKKISEKGQYVVVNSKFISTNGTVRKYSDTQICPLGKGDIVMVMSDIPNGKALAKCFFIKADDTFTLNQRICALKQKEADNKLLSYLINRNKYFLAFDSGVGQTNLRKDEVLDCPLLIPISIEEQQKISTLLTKVDKQIDLIQNLIDQTQQFKKGLLQQMFV